MTDDANVLRTERLYGQMFALSSLVSAAVRAMPAETQMAALDRFLEEAESARMTALYNATDEMLNGFEQTVSAYQNRIWGP